MGTHVTYKLGGYDPGKANNNEASSANLVQTESDAIATLTAKIPQALAANATYLALSSPTAAQNTAQIKLLTREVNALLRLAGLALSDTSDT